MNNEDNNYINNSNNSDNSDDDDNMKALSVKIPLKRSISSYLTKLYKGCENTMKSDKKGMKIKDSDIIIPTIHNYHILIKYNYNLQQLKKFCKHYNLKISGNKNELHNRIYVFLELSSKIVKIQSMYRTHIVKHYNLLRGPGLFNRQLCVNETDFLSGDNICDIKYAQLYTFEDKDHFVYGFDLISLSNLISRTGKTTKNPYTRDLLPKNTNKNINKILKMSKILNHQINITIEQDELPVKTLPERIIDLFYNIDLLGNYTDSQWFESLNKYQLIKFIRELIDIWCYRAQLSQQVRRNICPRGNPFECINMSYLNDDVDIIMIKRMIIPSLEQIINTGIDNDSQHLGAYYLLGALTMVSQDAAMAMPWLYQSFIHSNT